MERRIAALITLPLLSTAFLFACASLPAYGQNSAVDDSAWRRLPELELSARSQSRAVSKAKANASSKTPEKKMEKVVLQGVKLITPEKVIEANVDTADFTRLVHDIDTAVEYIMPASSQATTLVLIIECRPDGKTAHIAWQGAPQEKLQSLLTKLQEAIDSVENVKVKSGKIEFSMEYAINA